MRNLRTIGALLALATLGVYTAALVSAGTGVPYVGQGFNFDGTTYNLNDERCGLTGQNDANDGSTGQFATWNDGPSVNSNGDWGDGTGGAYTTGQGYLVWVLTANGATSATIALPDGVTYNMYSVGGTFKYVSGYFKYDELVGTVAASYEGKAKGKVQLTASHGCQPFEEEGAWCSPGYWRNAQDAAWTLTGYNKTDLFNNTVVPNFYDTASGANPTLIQVLTTPGANTFGSARNPYGLNAFNATGAFLTDQIPYYKFDPTRIGDENACPIDNHGNYKEP